jgi:hypothetical protein
MAYGPIIDYAAMKAQLYEVTMPDGGTALRTGRELLQRIGTDAIRDNVDQDFWIKAGVSRIWRDRMCNDDTRFLNEAEALRKLGWFIVRVAAPEDIRRKRIGGGFVDGGHPSEVEQDLIQADFVLVNDDSTTPQLLAVDLVSKLSAFTMSQLMDRVGDQDVS